VLLCAFALRLKLGGERTHGFEAISACAIMIAAQFGLSKGLGQRSKLRSFFQFSPVPVWPLMEIFVVPRQRGRRLVTSAVQL
jgi:hypothetical protein